MRPLTTGLVVAVVVSLGASSAAAADLHVAQGASGHGSAADPLGSIDAALSAASSGDRVVVHEGLYGDVRLTGTFESETVVMAAPDESVRMRTVQIQGRFITLRGMSVSLSFGGDYSSDTMVSVQNGSEHVKVQGCVIESVPDEVALSWSANDWAERPGTGISVRAPNTELTDNVVRNVGYGITIAHDAPDALVRANVVDNFSRDGLRGIGDFGVFEYNVVRNAFDVDDHHDDFFQSWSLGEDGTPGRGVRRGIVLRGNLFVNFTDREQPHAGSAQGIGCFDGFFEDWVIENNVVIVNHWHGITLLGARNVRIVNNTVFDNRSGETPGPPWIQVGPHKDGRPSENVVVRNNLTMDLRIEAEGAVEENNLVYDDPLALFVDADGLDLHLLDDAPAVDAGTTRDAPAIDRDGIPRPQGDGIDVGAYEWHDGTVEPVDGVPDEPGAGAGSGAPAGAGDGAARDTDVSCAFEPTPPRGSWPSGALTLLLGLTLAVRRRRLV